MSKIDHLFRYVSIINKVTNKSSTMDEIMHHLETQGEIQGFSSKMTARTFARYLDEIRTLFNIDIRYDYHNKHYYIHDKDDIGEDNRMLDILNSFQLLSLSEGMANYITFDRRRCKGSEHLTDLLRAIKNKLQVKMRYQKYSSEEIEPERLIEPYSLKQSQNIWYVQALNLEDAKIKIFGLDRIVDMEVTSKKFKIPEGLDTKAAFTYCFGVDTSGSEQPEEIILSFDPEEGHYIKSLPLHETQEVIVDNEDEYRIKLNLYLSYDFVMEILSRGERVKVIKPARLKNMVVDRLKATLARYEGEGG